MINQVTILSDVIRTERAQATSPARLERRRVARMVEALRCCTGPSLAARLRAAAGDTPSACCATA